MTTGEDQDDFDLAEIPKYAEAFRETYGKQFPIVLDYTVGTLASLDRFIDSNFEPHQDPEEGITLILFGTYVGETIRKELGGEWANNDEQGPVLTKIGGILETSPVFAVLSRFRNGEDASLAGLFEKLQTTIERFKDGELDPDIGFKEP